MARACVAHSPLPPAGAGESDRISPPEKLQGLAKLVPRAATHVVPGVGHLAHEEAPGAVLQLLAAFVRAPTGVTGGGVATEAPTPAVAERDDGGADWK